MATASFRINQPPASAYPNWDRARRDIDPYSIGSEAVELEAQNKSETSYQWSILSQPEGSSVVLNNDTTHTADGQFEVRGGYLIKLVVNDGLPTEDVKILYVGLPLEGSGLCVPALDETNYDNSQSPYDGAKGWGEKQNVITEWIHRHVAHPVEYVSTSKILTVSESGRSFFTETSSLTFTLPAADEGLRYIIRTGNVTTEIDADGVETVDGSYVRIYGSPWQGFTLGQYSYVILQSVPDGGGGWKWLIETGDGVMSQIGSPANTWFFGISRVENLATNGASGTVPVSDGSGGLTMTALTGGTDIDGSYDLFGASPATVDIDGAEGQGDLTFALGGAYSFVVDLSGATGSADGLQVVNGTDDFSLLRNGTDEIYWQANVNSFDIAATLTGAIHAGSASDLTLGARGSTVLLNETGSLDLSGFTASSIIGALYELQTSIASHSMDDAYNAEPGIDRIIYVDDGDVIWDLQGNNSFTIGVYNATDVNSGFRVDNGSDFFQINRGSAANQLDISAELYQVTLNSASDFTITGTDVIIQDIEFKVGSLYREIEWRPNSVSDMSMTVGIQNVGAGDSILDVYGGSLRFSAENYSGGNGPDPLPLADAGAADFTFSCNSLVDAINKAYSSAGSLDLDQAYENFGGAGTVTIDAGTLTWATSTTYEFVIDVSGSNDSLGFRVTDGASEYFEVLNLGASVKMQANTSEIDFASAGVARFKVTGSGSSCEVGNSYASGGNLILYGQNTSLNFNDSGINANLVGFTATSIVAALNECRSLTLDEIYNNGASNQHITIDNGNLWWDVTGANNFIVDAQSADFGQGFLFFNGATNFWLKNAGAGKATLETSLENVDIVGAGSSFNIESSGTANLVINQSSGSADIQLNARGGLLAYNDASNITPTGFDSVTSIVGCLNESRAMQFDDIYNNGPSAATRLVTIDDGDMQFDFSGAYSFVLDMGGVTAGGDGFLIAGGADSFNVTKPATDQLDVNGTLRRFILNTSEQIGLSSSTSVLVNAGSSGDVRMSAHGSGNIYLNEVGNVDLGTWFTTRSITSIVGALNTLAPQVIEQATMPTLTTDDDWAFWKNTTDSSVHLIFRRGVGDYLSVELA